MSSLDELERLARAATTGPWEATDGCAVFADGMNLIADTFSSGGDHPGADHILMPWPQPQCATNAAFIAAANPAEVLDLVGRVRQLEGEQEAYFQRAQEVGERYEVEVAETKRLLARVRQLERFAEYATRIGVAEARLEEARIKRQRMIDECRGRYYVGNYDADKEVAWRTEEVAELRKLAGE